MLIVDWDWIEVVMCCFDVMICLVFVFMYYDLIDVIFVVLDIVIFCWLRILVSIGVIVWYYFDWVIF